MKSFSSKDNIYLALATLFGAGYVPLGPGTASCLLAVLIFAVLGETVYFLPLTVISVVIAFMVSGKAEKILKRKDCQNIVIDDFSGMLLTFLFIPRRIDFIVVGFFLFRMLDMLKITPADRIEKWEGSLGVVGDDLVAGIYANAILQTAKLLLNIIS